MNRAATQSPGISSDAGGLTRDRLLVITLLIVTGMAIGACPVAVAPFLPALTWALALAVVANPTVQWIGKHVHKPLLAAGLAVAAVTRIRNGRPGARPYPACNYARPNRHPAALHETRPARGRPYIKLGRRNQNNV